MNIDRRNNHLFSIGEISKAVGITRRIILNYEAKGLVKPDVKDGSTGNRYYTIDTFTQIRAIRVFQNLGLSLDEIRSYFDDTTELLPLIKRLEIMRDELNLNIEKLYERTNKNPNQVKIITIDPQTVYRRTYHSPTIAERSSILRETALEAMRAYGTDTTKRMYFIEYPLKDTDEISYCIAVPSDSKGEYLFNISSIRGIAMYHYGAYEEIPVTRERLVCYAKENSLKLSGKCRHVYLEGPPQHKDKSKFITQIILLFDDENFQSIGQNRK